MLTIQNLTYRVGGREIIEDASVSVQDGWKLGVVGLNGAGKSTLFKLISGELQADQGKISMPEKQTFGQVRQDMPETDAPIIDLVIEAHEELAALLKSCETETDPYKIADIYTRMTELDAYTARSRAAILLTGLGFKDEELEAPFSSFSGGWKIRVALAAALFVEPDILLLDEPTNHLDLEAIMWLETYLTSYPYTLLMISHDREMLNKCVDHVVHVDQKKLTLYTGNYDSFERERITKLGLQQKMHEKQLAQRAHMQKFIDRFGASAKKATQAQSRVKALEKMDLVDAVIADRAIKFSFPQPEKISQPLISIKDVDVGYTKDVPILRKIYETIDMTDRIALLGANGNGKSTMIKLIADKLGAMKGEVVRFGKLRVGYFSQHQTEELDMNSTPYEEMSHLFVEKNGFFKESAVRAILGKFNFSKNIADNRIGDLSGGEKSRLLFAFMSYHAPHLLLLDEPTNHLDIDAREALVQALNNYEGAVVLVSHDPTMVERVANSLWLIKDGECNIFKGDLEDYRKFTIQSRRDERKKEKEKSKKAAEKKSATTSLSTLKFKAEDAEKLIAKLTKEKEAMEDVMGDADFYNHPENVKKTQQSYNLMLKNLEKQENIWIEAQAEVEKSLKEA